MRGALAFILAAFVAFFAVALSSCGDGGAGLCDACALVGAQSPHADGGGQ